MTPTQPIPNFSLLFKTQELKSKITQASFAFPLVESLHVHICARPHPAEWQWTHFFACLLPSTRLVHRFTVLCHVVRATRLVVLVFADGCSVGTWFLRNVEAIHPAISLTLSTLLLHLLLN